MPSTTQKTTNDLSSPRPSHPPRGSFCFFSALDAASRSGPSRPPANPNRRTSPRSGIRDIRWPGTAFRISFARRRRSWTSTSSPPSRSSRVGSTSSRSGSGRNSGRQSVASCCCCCCRSRLRRLNNPRARCRSRWCGCHGLKGRDGFDEVRFCKAAVGTDSWKQKNEKSDEGECEFVAMTES